jgi:hypothetical protein
MAAPHCAEVAILDRIHLQFLSYHLERAKRFDAKTAVNQSLFRLQAMEDFSGKTTPLA